MEDYTGNSQKQWISNANHSQSAEKLTTKQKKTIKYNTTNQEMDICILQSTNTKNYNSFQTNYQEHSPTNHKHDTPTTN
jgi:nitric oxide reductase large subunit